MGAKTLWDYGTPLKLQVVGKMRSLIKVCLGVPTPYCKLGEINLGVKNGGVADGGEIN